MSNMSPPARPEMSGEASLTFGGVRSRSRALFWVPVAACVAYGVAFSIVGEPHPLFYYLVVALAKTVGLVGSVLAAGRYSRGDRMRLVWLLFSTGFALLLVKDLTLDKAVPPAWSLSPALALRLRSGLTLAANLSSVTGAVLLARTWRVAGLTLAGSRTAQRVLLISVLALAGVIVGWGTTRDVATLMHGHSEAIHFISSEIGDFIMFSLIAPLVLTALTFRGGTLFWPYLYLSASIFAWLLYDMTSAFGEPLHFSPARVRALCELWRVLACSLHFAAGLSQRWAVRRSRRARI
jgi:hypothetical protein